jgi:Spy/CpxP family protein refolding chaperone
VRRWGLALALLLSLGVNIGILATLAVRRGAGAPPDRPGRPEEPRPLPPETGGEAEPRRVLRLADRLGLEGEQRRRFVRLHGRFFVETMRLRMEQAETFRELRRELTAPEPDRRRIEELTRASARAHLALQEAMAKNVIAARELLDPDQERLYLDIISRIRPPGLAGEPDRPRRPPPRQPRRPRWND